MIVQIIGSIIVILLILAIAGGSNGGRAVRDNKGWLPGALVGAELVFVEKKFFINAPFRVIGKPDQVYKRVDGKYVPVEYKTRGKPQVYETDVAQLSLQAWVLRRAGMFTAEDAFVVISNKASGRREAVPVRLRDDAWCEALIRRHIDVVSGKVAPTRSGGSKCRSCGHAGRCG